MGGLLVEATGALFVEATGGLLVEPTGGLLVEATGASSGARVRRRRFVGLSCTATGPDVDVRDGGGDLLAAALRAGELGGQVGEKAAAFRLAGTDDCDDGLAPLEGPAALDGTDGSCTGALGPRESSVEGVSTSKRGARVNWRTSWPLAPPAAITRE